MSDFNSCDRCGNVPYYEGHTDWCRALAVLGPKLADLEARVENLTKEIKTLNTWIEYLMAEVGITDDD